MNRKPKPAEQLRRDMVRRLLEALDKRLTLLETRMAPDAELGEAMHSAADLERDARSLTSLARLYAKLVELDDQTQDWRAGESDQEHAADRSSTMRTNSAAILRSALSASISQGTLQSIRFKPFRGRAQAPHYDFELWARDDQLPPRLDGGGEPWRVWLMLGGRGAGKTRAGAEWVRAIAAAPSACAGAGAHRARRRDARRCARA